jgi:hypothetical protein
MLIFVLDLFDGGAEAVESATTVIKKKKKTGLGEKNNHLCSLK